MDTSSLIWSAPFWNEEILGRMVQKPGQHFEVERNLVDLLVGQKVEMEAWRERVLPRVSQVFPNV